MTRAGRALVVAGAASGAGKTTATLGLIRALTDQGLRVAPAKSGPDFLDPGFLAAAARAEAATLDAFAMDEDAIRARAHAHLAATGADLLIVEGAMGLFDGAARAEDGRETGAVGIGATALVAAALGAPILLVVDAARRGQSVVIDAVGAAAILAAWRGDAPILAGVILNRIASERHLRMAAEALDGVGFPLLGALPRLEGLSTPSRHLGLAQARERSDLDAFLRLASDVMRDTTDLGAVAGLAAPLHAPAYAAPRLQPIGQRIAVAEDQAFGFLYPHLADDWRSQGAEIAFFSPLADAGPPMDADAVFLPGGYPELHGAALAAAETFKSGMRAAAERGALIYGECGGYMALGETMTDADGAVWPMLGLLPLETRMTPRRAGLGYRRLAPLPGAPFAGVQLGHEFHYAEVAREGALERLFQASDAAGADLGPIGLRSGSVCGSFAHLIAPERASAAVH